MKKTLLTLGLFLTLSSLFAQTTITLKPNASEGKDVYLDSRLSTENFGTHPDFLSIAWTNNGPVVGRCLIQFDLNQIPQGAVITSANLSLFGQNSPSNGSHSSLSGTNESEIVQVTSSWEESTVTWDNQPTISSVNSVVLAQNSVELQDYEVNVTSMIIDMFQNNNYGMMLKLIDENYYRRMVFASSDNTDQTKWPELSITYTLSNLGVKETVKNDATLFYPNPVKEILNIQSKDTNLKYEIVNQLGEIIQEGIILDSKIDVKNITSGIYFIKYENSIMKFIKN